MAEIIDQQQRLGEAEAVLVVAQRDVVGIARGRPQQGAAR